MGSFKTTILCAALAGCLYAASTGYMRVGQDTVLVGKTSSVSHTSDAVIRVKAGVNKLRDDGLRRELEGAIAAARTEGWDGPGSAAVSRSAAESARKLIAMIPPLMEAPDITVLPTGSISFDWDKGTKAQLALLALKEGGMAFALYLNGSRYSGTVPLDREVFPPLVLAAIQEWDAVGTRSPS